MLSVVHTMTDEDKATASRPTGENGLKGRPSPIELPKVPENGALSGDKAPLATPQFTATPTFNRASSQTPRTPRTPSLRRSSTFVDKVAEVKEEKSAAVESEPLTEAESKHRLAIDVPFLGRVTWEELRKQAITWLKEPLNIALLFWILGVVVSGAILFFVMTGMLNAQLSKSQRNTLFEICNQIINGLFTLMCILVHPIRLQHANRLYRWNENDIRKMRKVYCKGNVRKPNEWKHMSVVVFFLNMNCFSQYALAGLNWGYSRHDRPAIGVAVTLCAAIGFSIAASIYLIVSPLGKTYDYVEMEEEVEGGKLARRMSMVQREERTVGIVTDPQWHGRTFGCLDNKKVCLLSFTFCFCVFGHNMERLGLGNGLVHTVSFMLFCSAPFLVFTLAAGNLDGNVRNALTITGAILSVCGLMYGGYWRTQMRKRFKLPPKSWATKCKTFGDLVSWLIVPCCSLAQETRTAEFYDIEEAAFIRRPGHFGVGYPLTQEQSQRDEHGLPKEGTELAMQSFKSQTSMSSPAPSQSSLSPGYMPGQVTGQPGPMVAPPTQVAPKRDELREGDDQVWTVDADKKGGL
ncbi:PLAC8 family protein [Klebsormidium nitens]|uniref:PLAC8 family protein n=1 Tax=Klebsormidium nitens TaxID=105231 RepID=A0A1Y1HMQ7_KLENI|nr:PLAC8 family protein [Klebsormidium nitens]|eukprot:GAQ78281.1 PLAC8 family protein [Klebsormidium nitens]